MQILKGNLIAFGLFAGSFALHIVGGALDQDWLFNIAVVMVYIAASGFPVLAWWFAGSDRKDRATPILGAVIGYALSVSALRAANDRTLEVWHFPAAIGMVALTSVVLLGIGWAVRKATSGGASAPGERPSQA